MSEILKIVIKDPDIVLDRLPCLTQEERQLVISDWNHRPSEFQHEKYIHQLFEERARRAPDDVALEYEGQMLSYGELNRRANKVAHSLREAGVRQEVCVGLCAERSFEMVIALLAILKAGGAYVPLDPSYPASRLVSMIEDSRIPVVLADRPSAPKLPSGVPALRIDSLQAGPLEAFEENPQPQIHADSLAYVIYTSGSTGKPKGAMNSHKAILNRLLWMQNEFQLETSDRVLQKTPFSFDVSVWEFFWPLMIGARLVLARPGGHQDPKYLSHLIRQRGITTVHFVPSMLAAFLRCDGSAHCGSLKRLICSGEALTAETAIRFLATTQGKLYNLYGPTEAAVDVSCFGCTRESLAGGVRIGQPVANTSLYVLDPGMGPVPIGVSGELYIGGVQEWRAGIRTAPA